MNTFKNIVISIAVSAVLAIAPATSQAVVIDKGNADAAAEELSAEDLIGKLLSEEVMSRGKKTKTKIFFTIDTAGTYELKLEESELYDKIKKLKAKVKLGKKVIAKLKGPGVLEFDAEPGEYFLKIKTKVGKKKEGMFFAEIADAEIADANTPAAVPLPPAILLFGSALAVLAGISRRKGQA